MVGVGLRQEIHLNCPHASCELYSIHDNEENLEDLPEESALNTELSWQIYITEVLIDTQLSPCWRMHACICTVEAVIIESLCTFYGST